MSGALDWSILDDEAFVGLAADLLRRRGFSVIPQGDGPDGGVDLFATEPLSFGFEDPKGFTWAVQCKFSRKPSKAVSDSEIRDVEGVLRSARYASRSPKGYLLITNRRISQNVMERLRGIDEESNFRTSTLDGTRLGFLLQKQQDVVDQYFHSSSFPPIEASAVEVIWDPETIAMPRLRVKVRAPNGSSFVSADAYLDTGSDNVIPVELVTRLGLQPLRRVTVETYSGYYQANLYEATISIMDKIILERIQLLEAEQARAKGFILGAPALKNLRFLWDGPSRTVKIWQAP